MTAVGYRHDPIYRSLRWLQTRPSGEGSFAERWAATMGRPANGATARLSLINYKPFERARVAAQVKLPSTGGRGPAVHWVHLHLGSGLEAGTSPAPFRLPDHDLHGWLVPDAPNLSALREVMEPVRFRGLASASPELTLPEGPAPTLVRYVPTRRALLRWRHPASGRRYWLKLIAGDAAAAATLNLREIRAWYEHGAFTARVPRLAYYSPGLHVMVMDEVPGRPLTGLLTGCRPEPMAEVGRALAELHATPAVPGRAWSFEHEHRELRRHMRGVARALPAQAARLDRLVDGLGASRPGGAAGYAPIHGNLFGDQILYDAKAEPGRRVGIVDWDSWSHGDPHYDLGRLVAHLVFVRRLQGFPGGEGAAVEALLNGYRSVAGVDAIDPQRLAWQIATALLLRVKISSVRKLVPGWTRHVALALQEAERYLDGGFRMRAASSTTRVLVGRASP